MKFPHNSALGIRYVSLIPKANCSISAATLFQFGVSAL